MTIAIQCSPRFTTTAAAAPALPATMKLLPLHRKSSRHTVENERPLESAIAPAIRPVLTKKYVATAPTSGRASGTRSLGAGGPPSDAYAAPVAAIVTASAAALNTDR